MFDVRPVNEAGDLDMEKVRGIKRIAQIPRRKTYGKIFEDAPRKIIRDLKKEDFFKEEFKRFQAVLSAEKLAERKKKRTVKINNADFENINNISVEFHEKGGENYPQLETLPIIKKKERKIIHWEKKKYFFAFAGMAAAVLIFFVAFNFVQHGFKLKSNGMQKGQAALADMAQAADSLRTGDFQKSSIQFNNAREKLQEISQEVDKMGSFLVEATRYIPLLSKVSSADNLVSAGGDVSQIGILLSGLLEKMEKIKAQSQEGEDVSYLQLFQNTEENLQEISRLMQDAQIHLEKVNVDDLEENQRGKIIEIKIILPEINKILEEFLGEEKILVDLLGGNGPRKYLFLFQNNQEMRATGGFIGTYGLLDIFDGRVRKFFIDGIFNPDGQLTERIVPPVPIQKISANWSLHDSNWWPDFPKSAEKAAWFYEKTGGPTVDGVITMTPTVMQKFLEVTGPIEMPEYGVTVDSQNFIEKIQYEVEVDYDKELNQPKKILADLAPKILDKIFNAQNFSDLSKTLNILLESLNEKQILVYSKNWEMEKVLSENGWSGEVLNTPKDYVSVINTNINGFKTDGVIEEKIYHQAEIQMDGTIINTLTVERKHNGGDTPYDFWNKVNADYLRVYVPKGSRLISAEGQTREFNSPPLDYNALGYRRDAQVQIEENSIRIDDESGTRVYEDGEKTVFANWIYVSPQETVVLKYTYILPFKINMDEKNATDTYSLLAQKQSGSLGSQFVSEIYYPIALKILWQYPEKNISTLTDLPDSKRGVRLETDLKTDKFLGVAFSR